jgi:hypothetical protein
MCSTTDASLLLDGADATSTVALLVVLRRLRL